MLPGELPAGDPLVEDRSAVVVLAVAEAAAEAALEAEVALADPADGEAADRAALPAEVLARRGPAALALAQQVSVALPASAAQQASVAQQATAVTGGSALWAQALIVPALEFSHLPVSHQHLQLRLTQV